MPVSPEQIQQIMNLYEEYGNCVVVAEVLSMTPRTVQRHVAQHKEELIINATELPGFPDDDIPVEEIIKLMEDRYSQRETHAFSKKWMPFRPQVDGPIGVAFVGDPHLDNNGCNWPLLTSDVKIIAEAEGMYGVNIGDTTDNWVGRLIKEYANSDTSRNTATKLIKWFMKDCGINWWLWLHGNHDLWNYGDEILEALNNKVIIMEDWQCQFKIVFKNKVEGRVWAAHTFPGNSMWNSLHAMQKAAHMKDWAHLYIGGHTHNWALHKEESASKEFIYWLARARGYKFLDDYADRLGHQSQQSGATIISVWDPYASREANFLQCYDDVEEGASILEWKRGRWAASKSTEV